MKRFLFGILLLLSINETNAQFPKLIVQFTNKSGTPYSINTPSQYLSARAIARRTRYNIAIDSFDLPIVPRYIDSVLSKGPVTLLSKSKWLNQVLIQCTDQPTLNRIMALPFVKSVQGVGYRPSAQPVRFKDSVNTAELAPLAYRTNVDNYNYGNSYNQVHIHEGEFLHNLGFDGKGMMIGVLDAGFNSYKTITAFDSVRMNGQILGERDFVAYDNSVNEDDTHGMYCLSTMCANRPGRMVGTAPKANYWLVRTENAATEFPIEEHNWVVGAEFVDSCGADMISSSLGYNTFDDASFNHHYAQFYQNATMVSKGATQAAKKGMIVMNSAGNEGTNSWKYLIFPADADSVCAVGAVSQSGIVVGFSSYGYPGKVKPNIASVGGGTVIAGFGNNPTTGNGTSFANPNIAGLIACLWQAFPEFNNMEILDAVYKSSSIYTAPNDRIGYGIPNMRLAYQALDQKRSSATFANGWLQVRPTLFNNTNTLLVKLKAQENGRIGIRLIDMMGRVMDKIETTITQNNIYQFSFRNANALARGVYFVQYVGTTEKKTIRVLKQ
jgi:subtilisin family serine protease